MAQRRQKNYTDREKAAALAVLDFCNGNESEAARRCGVPRQTLQEWAAGRNQSADVPGLRHEKKREMADLCEDFARKALESLLNDLGVITPRDMVAVGIAIDKMLLLRGQPNTIAESRQGDGALRELVEQQIALVMQENGWDREMTVAELRKLPLPPAALKWLM